MDNPIAKKEHFAETRVQQALESGAHYIDADDVRGLIDEYERTLESNRDWVSSLRSQIDHNVTVNGMVIKSCNALRDSNNELKQQLAEARLALDVSQGQAKRLEAEADALRGLRDDRAVYKAPDVSQGGESLMQQVFARGIPPAAPSWGRCAVNGAPNGRHCPASYVFDIRRCTGREPCEHKREGE